ncbi:unnamed protein product [Kluyveromyces dobzhanskii CBS 2104]|uniref:Delta 8-(E)-sphingolipid desaturase n=1 Tax=Kluyveromyces dobzhanskii CBS 2104 TaxID=1427455 RepID=A0A0A8L7T8_9SACH|nr:unnamed protein product [Kluyveromyces dobzhanskii CBS 2104]
MSSVLSRRDIADRIANGQTIVIYDDVVLNLDKWIKSHPGGDKSIYHMVGRDATDEMNAYHDDKTVATFKKWKIGRIDYAWENMLPPIQGGRYLKAGEKYTNNDVDIKLTSKWRTVNTDDQYTKLTKHDRMAGESEVKIYPKIPQGVVPSVDLKEAYEKKVVVDPAIISENYDNELVYHDLTQFPSLDVKTQEWIALEYRKLHEDVVASGLYQCNYTRYLKECLRIGTLFGISFYLLSLKWYVTSALFLGFAWQQLVFIAHDAGHISITHNYQVDNIIGMVIASWIGGLSLGWWKRNHNVHHLITNDPVHDPDIQHLPFFAVSTRLFHNVYSTYYDKFLWFDKFAEKVVPFQHYLYYPILCFGRFNLYRLSWVHVLLGQGPRSGKAAWFRYFELAGLTFFNYWFFYLIIYKQLPTNSERFKYVFISHVATMIVHVQITLSHFAMSTSDLGVTESFPMRQLRTSMDVDCPRWLDFFHGGLQFQVIHHLFPRLPRHNLRDAQALVIKFCDKVGIKYSIYGFAAGNDAVISHLHQIAQQAHTMLECAKTMKKEAIHTNVDTKKHARAANITEQRKQE